MDVIALLSTYPFFSILLFISIAYKLRLLPKPHLDHIDKTLEPVFDFLSSLAESGNAFADQYNDSYIDPADKDQ
ncbi:hypothetical protein TL16_g13289 [Triparma laevis f. inornata]|uniref:Uncharacterized protein n=1 Tax=Triparma laevis f. inornata TaxID=1714386 RepID=A0A9W7BRR7_9STRA|nr:hypothetical protein TL16_g13289 [Triparma laevis f. inornata]